MAFKKGQKKLPNSGRKKGTPNARNELCKTFAEEFGIPFLIRIAKGEEKEAKGKPVSLAMRKDVAEYLIDQGIGRAAIRHEIGGGETPVSFTLLTGTEGDEG